MKDCRRCQLSFSESEKHWTTDLKMQAMPPHCKDCRLKNREEKKALKAANALVAVVPVSAP